MSLTRKSGQSRPRENRCVNGEDYETEMEEDIRKKIRRYGIG